MGGLGLGDHLTIGEDGNRALSKTPQQKGRREIMFAESEREGKDC